MVNKKLKKFLIDNPGYKKWGSDKLQEMSMKKLDIIVSKNTIKETKKSLKVPSVNKLVEKYSVKKVSKPINFKRLFFDIETSYNVVSSWRIGNKISITHDNIIKERAIICVSWKLQGENKVHSLNWDNGCDKQLLIDFVKVLNSAEEIIGHNSDRFDLRWIRTRCIFHGIPLAPAFQTLDTLKLARSNFNFNNNRLDYLGKFLGFGGKLDTGGFKLWQEIIMNNCQTSLKKMVKYCEQDVLLLENVYNKLNPYTLSKTHVGVAIGESKCSCPNCGSDNSISNGNRISAAGVVVKKLQCVDCHKYYNVNLTSWNKYNELNMKVNKI